MDRLAALALSLANLAVGLVMVKRFVSATTPEAHVNPRPSGPAVRVDSDSVEA
jgi:hypothetical protein